MFCQMETTMIVTVAIDGVPNQLIFASQSQPNTPPSAGIAFVKINTQIKDTNTALTMLGMKNIALTTPLALMFSSRK